LNALGHDPLLGWLFGVRDVLMGGFSAIGADGRLVIQTIPLEAFKSVAGHLLSDVTTKAGLPPPLFGLLLLIQRGGIGDHSIADIARAMYRSGYDFRHFLAGGATVAVIEVFVRTAWTVHELSEGKKLAEGLPVAGPRLRSGLFLAHSVATAVNAGKVAITQNPLSINWAQWLAFFRYAIPQMHWLVTRAVFIQEKFDQSWKQLDDEFAITWSKAFGSVRPAILSRYRKARAAPQTPGGAVMTRPCKARLAAKALPRASKRRRSDEGRRSQLIGSLLSGR
jgi:hypothetical protein